MSNCHGCFIRFLLLSFTVILLAPTSAMSEDFTFVGCYGRHESLSNPHASMNLWRISPYDYDSRLQKCLNFCTSGTPPAGADNVYITEGGFPHRFAGYSLSNWCFCGGQLSGSATAATGSGADRCGQTINVYQRGAVVQPPPQTINQPPRAPTVSPGGWEPPFPVGLEGAIQLTWQDNGDPDGDLMTFWIEIWWWNAAENKWVMLTAEWANPGYYTLTTSRGLVPNIYYAWRVAAVDSSRRSNPWYTYSPFSMFRTVP